jgi:hypothetical protein
MKFLEVLLELKADDLDEETNEVEEEVGNNQKK